MRFVPQPQPRAVAELDEIGELIELRGQVEALQVIHNPLDGSEAVLLSYSARIRALAERQIGIDDPAARSHHVQGTSFLLRDASGVALIEVEAGEDIEAIHAKFLAAYDAGIMVDVEMIAPGERVRVRGRVRELVGSGSPHRSGAWSVVIGSAEIERCD